MKSKPLVFIHVPKTAGTSIRKSLNVKMKGKIPGWDRLCSHLPASHPKITKAVSRSEDSIAFGVVRNPYDRAISLWRYFRMTPRQRLRFPNSLMIEQLLRVTDFETFWTGVNFNRFLRGAIHFRPQSYYIDREWVRTLRFENLQDDFDALCDDAGRQRIHLPRSNNSQARGEKIVPEEVLTPAVIKAINRIYRSDFENFNYQKR
jgi:hypothetical protein